MQLASGRVAFFAVHSPSRHQFLEGYSFRPIEIENKRDMPGLKCDKGCR